MLANLGDIFSPVRLLVRQSKSLRLFLFEPEAVRASNCNLLEFGRAQELERDYRMARSFVLPPGGVRKGLSGRFLKISKVKKQQKEADAVDEEDKEEEAS